MYFMPNPYPNCYMPYRTMSQYPVETTLQQGMYPQELDAVYEGIQKEAAAIDFYYRLADVAPNQKHKNEILHALEDKKEYFGQFMNLYTALTGSRPMHQNKGIRFHTYKEGLEKAYEVEVERNEAYQTYGSTSHHPFIRNIFTQASEKNNVQRFDFLLNDYGGEPFVVNIEEAAERNKTFRTALWTGDHLQVTLMSIDVGEDIGLEVHPDIDQFFRIEEGQGLVQMGDSKNNLDFEKNVYEDVAIVVPAGKWHNLTNTGDKPIKLYSIYAPPEHPYGTVHETKAIAMAVDEGYY
ncbi:cupin domain-containing protein [Virgibacillus alimentarius]|uniref:Mannose-6-phosphate isomerase-like protein (Cupin superfamily) n=1 Tax=Virgibacillus alimentarius TaxID=698769 RepID=A0ABS4SDH1_9BACI|nr:cupin domain-containing protein [Virgibacillus alimentarius]MBP2258919.1 mannose-6-phosphate isomerase-like protein (cupin superfamily) [Virgibacillus alimentarius]